MALSPDGDELLTGSFDSTLIRWSLPRSVALNVHRFHEGAVNTVIFLSDSRFASAGEDGRIAIWTAGGAQPTHVLEGHTAPVVALALSRDGRQLASASWDGTARIWPLDGGAPRVLDGHKANVNGVGFLTDGRVVTADYTGTVRVFGSDEVAERTAALGAPISVLTIAQDDEIIVAGADGKVRFLGADLSVDAELAIAPMPLASLAVSRDGKRLAVAGFRGTLAIVDRLSRTIERVLDGPAFPVWSLAFSADGTELLTGGANRVVRRWVVATGEPVSPVEQGRGDDIPQRLRTHPGAAVFKACVACHTLTPEGGNRAGPTLAGIFGRRIATAPGYAFSPALTRLDIIWSAETIQRLFEIGPHAYTPGTKMPEQKINRLEDRQALTDFLAEAQRP